MKIAKLEFTPVSVPYTHREVSSLVNRDGVTDIIVKATTDDGLVGWGESCSGANVTSVLGALEGTAGSGPRIPVLLGGCGTGRTSLLLRLRDLIGRTSSQYIDVERIATTPERFLAAVREHSPFPAHPYGQTTGAEPGAREAFDATLALLDTARAPGETPATFLLDEFLELRTFESFPGLRSVLRDLVGALGASGNRIVLTARYTARALRLLRDAPPQFEIIHVAPLTAAEIRATLPATGDAASPSRNMASIPENA